MWREYAETNSKWEGNQGTAGEIAREYSELIQMKLKQENLEDYIDGAYNVQCPNALWHVDTNHKLVHWNFVIFGCIDGFSRLTLY